jgi:hypothetical protein
MAEGTVDGRDGTGRAPSLWTALVRIFQVTLDPKKLLLAAAGILCMGLGWWVLSKIAYSTWDKPIKDSPAYSSAQLGVGTEEERAAIFQRDFEAWKLLHRVAGVGTDPDAGPGGDLRTLPWFEDRGPNPFLLVTAQIGRPWSPGQFIEWFFTTQVPILVEPLTKLLKPVVYLFNPAATPGIRFFLLGVLSWELLVWAFFGGMITRLAAVELAGKDPLTVREAARFVLSRYLVYLSAPLAPVVVVGLLVLLQILFGLVLLIPLFGDIVVAGLGFPIVLVLAIAQALLLIGLIGYPLMFSTVSVEGNDTLDAVSRTYNYVYQSIWSYLGYGIAAVIFGAVLVFFVQFLGSTMAYLSKWGINQTPFAKTSSWDRRPEFLFVYAPTTFGWRDLLLQGTPAAEPDGSLDYDRPTSNYNRWVYGDPATGAGGFTWYNKVGAFMVGCWLGLLLLVMLGFGYAFFWVAGTEIYYLMRRKVDDTDPDEVYLEDETAEEPFSPPPTTPATVTSSQVTMVEPPTLRSAPPPAPSAPPTSLTPPPTNPATPPASGSLVERPAALPEPPPEPARPTESTALAPEKTEKPEGGKPTNGPAT